jgi:glutamate-1-semialdehyde 2,1-aminomutase
MSRIQRTLRAINPVWRLTQRLRLSRAKHRSLAGHPRLARHLARGVPEYGYDAEEALAIDGAPVAIRQQRAVALDRLESALRERAPRTLAASETLAAGLSDMQLVGRNRVPFQFRDSLARRLGVGAIVQSAEGVCLRDLDDNTAYDLGGSYGVNLFGNEVYRGCIDQAVAKARDLGLVLGAYHPVVLDNVARLRALSGMDEVSFHMSGTEAVMQAVRLARYHTGRRHLVRFAGAYHGWWDGVQPGPGNPLPVDHVYTLEELSGATLTVLRTRDDIACVLVNPLQALNPNGAPAADSALVAGVRTAHFDKDRYVRWLTALRAICDARGIALIFDEVFVGFRLAKGGAQEFFGVRADLVTYGKTLGGGLPVGVVCGRRRWMRRFRDDRPADLCFARGTFSAHPYVMTAMNAMLHYMDTPAAEATWDGLEARWNERAARWNAALDAARVPVRVANMASVFTTNFTKPGRFHWLLQYYLRAEGLSLAWVGTGRFIFSHDYTDDDVAEVIRRFVRAAQAMDADGWFWRDPAASESSIRSSITREILRQLIGRGRPAMRPGSIDGPEAADPASVTR